jgi:hypothetical protein
MRKNLKNTRAQSAVEFMIIVGAMMVFMVAFLGALEANRADKIRENRDILLNDVAMSIQDEVNLAYSASDGYARNFNVIGDAYGSSFNASIRDNSVFVRTDDGKHAVAQPIMNVSGDIKIGQNVIEKINGTVYLNRI